MKKQRVHTAQLVFRAGKLVFRNQKQKQQFEEFQKELGENTSVEMFYAAAVEEGTLRKLAQIHAAIRTLADEVGTSPQEMKVIVKKHGKYMSGEILDSFGDYDARRLDDVFKTICEIGDGINCNVR